MNQNSQFWQQILKMKYSQSIYTTDQLTVFYDFNNDRRYVKLHQLFRM